jgi:broad specificity phosphatase PhoE
MALLLSATLLVTHGNLMTLLLKRFDDRIGFAKWQPLTNPDVYSISFSAERADRGSGMPEAECLFYATRRPCGLGSAPGLLLEALQTASEIRDQALSCVFRGVVDTADGCEEC